MQTNGANRQGIQWHFVPFRIRRRVAHILSNDRPRDSRFSSPFYRPPRAWRVADERGCWQIPGFGGNWAVRTADESGRSRVQEFVNSDELAAALAVSVAGALRGRLAKQGQAALAVSGGTTPVKFFEALSRTALDWARVRVTLVDDRCVPEESPRSNARLLRAHLLQNDAAAAAFLPLIGATEQDIAALPLPFAAVVLGMGLDGHTASFFPGGDHLAQALAGERLLETMNAPGAGEPRLTLTLPTLIAADFTAVHIEGAAKLAVLREAQRPDGPDFPIRAVLARKPAPEIYWCP